jgi:regulator of sirC expression with transglutaminase-like and TPR domain
MSQEDDIRALVRLVEDTNPELAQEAANILVSFGQATLPALRELADYNPALATSLTHRIEGNLLQEEWIRLAKNADAEAAAILVARWLDPLSSARGMSKQLDALAEPLQGVIPSGTNRISYRRDALALREWLAGKKRFQGNPGNYYAPENSLLPHLLKTRLGIPLSLSMIYLFVGRRLGAPLYPIGMPAHFIVRYGDATNGIYIDPYHKGALMTPQDCRRLLNHLGYKWRDQYLQEISDQIIIERMLRNLINAYKQQNKKEEIRQIQKYLDIWLRFRLRRR